ncbi:protein phosphatase 1H isoform X2 [Triplophysa rosa]|uniref:protein phosphatase 1H isoform X2 n=1 Tax=Triplophysa rosa TaxID=992332 RepID=UPI002546053B|nr:protein phosphatase 1H isoform X2 [Triplophysa rosa]
MMTRVRSAVSSILGGMMSSSAEENHAHRADPPLRFQYCRPEFLALSPDEVECSADHISRPILILKDSKLPWATGYAEVINAGKSALNEDQACCEVVELRKRPEDHSSPSYTPTSRRRSSLPSADILETIDNPEHKELNFHYWGLFDGHGGSGAAVFASKFLHLHVEEQLQEVLEILQNPSLQPPTCLGEDTTLHPLHPVAGCSQRGLSRAASLRGAAGAPGSPNTMTPRFFMEKKIKQESLVVGAIENAFKEMDAHIGRERAVYLISGGCTALVVIYLLGKLYVANAGDSRAYKTVQEEDLKFPLIYGEGKKARVLATIGISRGLGDHDLKVHDSDISIKPFLSCSPEVKVYDLSQCERGADDVMVLATDGLWDVLSNEEVAEAITGFLGNCDPDDQHRYTMTAQDLVMKARGVLKDRGWRIAGDRLGSGDDISVFIIPLMHSSSNEAEAS